jgi:hypothetical protein
MKGGEGRAALAAGVDALIMRKRVDCVFALCSESRNTSRGFRQVEPRFSRTDLLLGLRLSSSSTHTPSNQQHCQTKGLVCAISKLSLKQIK